MRERRRGFGGGNHDDAVGWISMADLLVMFVVVAITVVGVMSRNSDQLTGVLGGSDWVVLATKLKEDRDKAVSAVDASASQLGDSGKEASELRQMAARLAAERDEANVRALAAERNINQLRSELDAARSSVSGERTASAEQFSKVEQLTRELSQLEKIRSDAEEERRKLEQMLSAERQAASGLRQDLRIAEERLGAAERDAATRANQVSVLKQQQARAEQSDFQDRQLRQELLGISGSLDRVVFVVDESDSMQKDPRRWGDAKQVIRTWIERLPVREAAVVTFSSGIRKIPEDGTMVGLSDADKRLDLVKRLEAMTAGGGSTNMKQALEVALRYPSVSAIVLFTDGAPDSSAGFSVSGGSESDAIRELVSGVRGASGDAVRLHVVAVGDYFRSRSAKFLIELAKAGDGAFIGR
jgi:hypothetical protein